MHATRRYDGLNSNERNTDAQKRAAKKQTAPKIGPQQVGNDDGTFDGQTDAA
jgi:hypothetical protein